MEIEIKKSKITKNIVKQIPMSYCPKMLGDYEVLGWVQYDKVRYVISYNSSTKSLYKTPYTTLDRIKLTQKNLQFPDPNLEKGWIWPNMWICDIWFVDFNYGYTITQKLEETEEHFMDIIEKYKSMYLEANQKGQFFI